MGLKPAGVRRAPAAIELHIDELVLHGFRSSDRFGIGDAMERELARLISEQGVPTLLAQPSSRERLDAGTFKLAARAKPQMVGTQLAQSLHEQLSGPEKTRSPKTQAHAKEVGKAR